MTDEERAIVKRIRAEFEERRTPQVLVAQLYYAEHPMMERNCFISTALAQFPTLNCGVATAYIKYRLGRGETIHGNYAGYGHTFLILDGLVVDITADQFGGPKIYVGPLIRPWCCGEPW